MKKLWIAMIGAIALCSTSPASPAHRKDRETSGQTIGPALLYLMDGSKISGEIVSGTENFITIIPGTGYERRKGIIRSPVTIPAGQIRSIKLKKTGLYLAMILLGAGISGLGLLLISGNTFNMIDDPGFFLIGPLSIIAGIAGLLSRKKFYIGGDLNNYRYFQVKLKIHP